MLIIDTLVYRYGKAEFLYLEPLITNKNGIGIWRFEYCETDNSVGVYTPILYDESRVLIYNHSDSLKIYKDLANFVLKNEKKFTKKQIISIMKIYPKGPVVRGRIIKGWYNYDK
jgi:hypothetical protein